MNKWWSDKDNFGCDGHQTKWSIEQMITRIRVRDKGESVVSNESWLKQKTIS